MRSITHAVHYQLSKLRAILLQRPAIDPCSYKLYAYSYNADTETVYQHLQCACGNESEAWTQQEDFILDWLTVKQFQQLKQTGWLYVDDKRS